MFSLSESFKSSQCRRLSYQVVRMMTKKTWGTTIAGCKNIFCFSHFYVVHWLCYCTLEFLTKTKAKWISFLLLQMLMCAFVCLPLLTCSLVAIILHCIAYNYLKYESRDVSSVLMNLHAALMVLSAITYTLLLEILVICILHVFHFVHEHQVRKYVSVYLLKKFELYITSSS